MEILFVRPRSFDHTSLSHDEHFDAPATTRVFCSTPFPFPLERHHSTGTPRRHSKTTRHGTTRHGTARHGTARHGTTRHDTTQHDTSLYRRARTRETRKFSRRSDERRDASLGRALGVAACVYVCACA
ncbi:hypothetical protein ALC53_09699 [Atta colombica]|uniref:Uncharacterized protein n=1 Tax=Atta colombica TaxID=520822 RepID=A0A195B685_9HYME|nr:hypothetical protein ALC53_09699 [Atta colombica]